MFHGLEDAPREAGNVVKVRDVLHDDHKFVPAKPGNQIVRAHALDEPGGDTFEKNIPTFVTVMRISFLYVRFMRCSSRALTKEEL